MRRKEAGVREGKEVWLQAGIHRSAFSVPRVAGGERGRRMREGKWIDGSAVRQAVP